MVKKLSIGLDRHIQEHVEHVIRTDTLSKRIKIAVKNGKFKGIKREAPCPLK